MRKIQVLLFSLGLISFFASLFFMGQVTGDIFWRAGIAAMLTDLAIIKLWPAASK